jgi:predicted transposase/invertase (TIGR01784 family)
LIRVFLENTLRQLPPEFRREVMTIVDYVEHQVFEQGIQRGIEQGKQQNAFEIARQMLAEGVDRTLIRKFTRLSEKQLEELI